MSQALEWTEMEGFAGSVLLVRATHGDTFAVYGTEADALSGDADSRALAVVRDDLLTDRQQAIGTRNRERLSDMRE
jgi:hypothetical protein